MNWSTSFPSLPAPDLSPSSTTHSCRIITTTDFLHWHYFHGNRSGEQTEGPQRDQGWKGEGGPKFPLWNLSGCGAEGGKIPQESHTLQVWVWQLDSHSEFSAAFWGSSSSSPATTWACFMEEAMWQHDSRGQRGSHSPLSRGWCHSMATAVACQGLRAVWGPQATLKWM